MIFVILRLVDQAEKHVKDVRSVKIRYGTVGYQPEVFATDESIQRDYRSDPNRTKLVYHAVKLSKNAFKLIKKMRHLEILELQDCEFEEKWLVNIENLRLDRLVLSGTDLSDEGCKHIAKIPTITHLHIYDTKISGKAFEILKPLTNLFDFEVQGNALGDADVEGLRAFPLQYLDINGTSITDQACDTFASFDNLHKIDLSGTKLTGAGLIKLKDLKKLNEFKMKTADLKDEDLAAIAQLQSLEKMDLGDNPFTDKGLLQLAKLKKLIVLVANSCPNITADGVKKLQKLNPKLAVLWTGSSNKYQDLLK